MGFLMRGRSRMQSVRRVSLCRSGGGGLVFSLFRLFGRQPGEDILVVSENLLGVTGAGYMDLV